MTTNQLHDTGEIRAKSTWKEVKSSEENNNGQNKHKGDNQENNTITEATTEDVQSTSLPSDIKNQKSINICVYLNWDHTKNQSQLPECCNQGQINHMEEEETMESKTMTDREEVTSQNQNEDGFSYSRESSRNRKNDRKKSKQKDLTEIAENSIDKNESPLSRERNRNKKAGKQTKNNTSSSGKERGSKQQTSPSNQ
ncbi:uncharacterized protein [Nicotiana sylvestris]|uniref:uncharacterized protein n=1 Tax=Nicotiana sylvestris TaxID=4096 RepID=UPI00388CCBA0